MNERDHHRLINNPRHIPGIHNYCDRWCERCPLTLRCSVFAIEYALDKNTPPHDRALESLWPRLESLQPLAQKLLSENLDHPGIPLNPNPKFKSHNRPLDSHPLGAAAKRYLEFTHKFLCSKAGDGIAGGPPSETPPTNPPSASAPNLPITPAEALDILNTYHMLIPVKLSRALHHDELDDEIEIDPDFAEAPNDHDGSAKLTLLLIDRSLLAWTALALHHPTLRETTALPAILTLHRLHTAIKKSFPNAPLFIRPGFDTLHFPKK